MPQEGRIHHLHVLEDSWIDSTPICPPNCHPHPTVDLEKKVKELEAQIGEILMGDRYCRNSHDFSIQSPFSTGILDEPVPYQCKMPLIDPYNSSINPIDHLEGYKAIMPLWATFDAMLCLAFPATLKKAARMWFSSLPSGSIHSFQQLGHSMVTHFASHRPSPKNNDSLFSLKQDNGETLRSYVAHFNAATLEVKNLNESIMMSVLKRGLRNGCLTFSLDKNFLGSYAELLECATEYA